MDLGTHFVDDCMSAHNYQFQISFPSHKHESILVFHIQNIATAGFRSSFGSWNMWLMALTLSRISCEKNYKDASLQVAHPVVETVCLRMCFGHLVFISCYFDKCFYCIGSAGPDSTIMSGSCEEDINCLKEVKKNATADWQHSAAACPAQGIQTATLARRSLYLPLFAGPQQFHQSFKHFFSLVSLIWHEIHKFLNWCIMLHLSEDQS